MDVVRLMRMLGVALLWAVGVALVASMSWVAINSAGRQVVDTTLSAGTLGSGTGSDAGTPGTDVDPADPTPTTVTSLAPPSSISKSGPTTAGPSRSVGGSISPSVEGPSSSSRTTPRMPFSGGGDGGTVPPTTAAPGPVSDTMTSPGGVVWLQCTGSRVSDYLAQPSSDWSGMAARPNGGTLVIDFVNQRHGIRIVGTCPSGQPHFDVSTYDSHGGDDHGDD